MKRIFLLLMGLVALNACSREKATPQSSGGVASERTELVSLRLIGYLELPYDDFDTDGKALTLVPGSKGGASVLTPTYTEGEQVEAVAYATSTDGKLSSGAQPLTLTVGKGGRKFLYHGDLSLPASMVGSEIIFSVFIGFDPSTGELKTYPMTAPYYAKTGPREIIKDYPIALQARAEISARSEVKGGSTIYSYQHSGLHFRLVGSLIRCALTNETDRELTVTGLELHGLGATGLKLAKPTSGTTEEVFVTSDEIDPALSVRTYTLPEPKKLLAGAKEEYFLVYAPLVSQSDGRNLVYKGYVRPKLDDPDLQAEYANGQTVKVLPSDRGGKLALTNVLLGSYAPIKPNAIPLQYWNNFLVYKSGEGQVEIKQPGGYLGRAMVRGITADSGVYVEYMDDYEPYFINPLDIHASDVTSLGKSVHIPSKLELDAIFPPKMLKEATTQEQRYPEIVSPYYPSGLIYSKDAIECGEVAGKVFVGKSSFWRDYIKGSISDDVVAFLSHHIFLNPPRYPSIPVMYPLYALRFSALSSKEIEDSSLDYKGINPISDNKSRVAYMYIMSGGSLRVASCYIGENSSIVTAQDLYEQNVFVDKGNHSPKFIKSDYNGHRIFQRIVGYSGALYSSLNVNAGERQRPMSRWDVSVHTRLKSIYPSYPSATLAPNFPRDFTSLPVFPSSGLLYRKTSADNDLVAGWFFRGNEGQIPAPAPVIGYTYDDRTAKTEPITKYLVKDLPTGGGRYFAFPLWLMSDTPSTVQK